MQNKSRAFTLIELLVVVLIIGILAAVAVPQYQKAVEKARLTEALVLGKHIRDLEEIYYLANGEYTNNFADLGMEQPALNARGDSFQLDKGANNRVIYYYHSRLYVLDLALFFWYQNDTHQGIQCYAYTDHGTELCKVLKF